MRLCWYWPLVTYTPPHRMHFMPIGPTLDRDSIAQPDERTYVQFYTAYGECFSAWSSVEVNLFAVFMFLVQSPHYQVASSAFYSTAGFRAKLDMVDASVRNSPLVDPSAREKWSALKEKLTKSSRRRNQLAHDTVFFGRDSEHDTRKMFVASPHKPSAGARLHTHDLKEIRQSFERLAHEIFQYWQSLNNLAAPTSGQI